MIPIYLFIGIILCSFSHISSAKELDCHLHDVSYNGTVAITFDREELSIYKYNDTQYVNFLLRDLKIKFDGVFDTEKKKKQLRVGLKTDVEGIAKLQETSLANCHFNLIKNAKVVNNVPLEIQVKIVQLAHACIQPKLCPNLGNAKQDDSIRSKIDRYDFGENSVMFDAFAEKYPNLKLPGTADNQLQSTINLLADFWLASLITQMSKKQPGQIKLPDVNETIPGVRLINQGYFKLSDGTFGNLKDITRLRDLSITHKGLQFTVQAEYKLPLAHIHFNKYQLKYGLVNTNGQIDIKINGVTFYLKVTLNYNSNPCVISVPEIHSKIGEITFELSNNGVFDTVMNELTNGIINKYILNLVSFLETKIKEAIKKPLESFNCEKYRP